jgi:hypothetical protein
MKKQKAEAGYLIDTMGTPVRIENFLQDDYATLLLITQKVKPLVPGEAKKKFGPPDRRVKIGTNYVYVWAFGNENFTFYLISSRYEGSIEIDKRKDLDKEDMAEILEYIKKDFKG